MDYFQKRVIENRAAEDSSTDEFLEIVSQSRELLDYLLAENRRLLKRTLQMEEEILLLHEQLEVSGKIPVTPLVINGWRGSGDSEEH